MATKRVGKKGRSQSKDKPQTHQIRNPKGRGKKKMPETQEGLRDIFDY